MAVAEYAEWFASFAVPGVLAMFLLTATMFIGLASRFTEEQDREWWGRTGSWVLIVMVIWSTLSAVVIFGPGLIAWTPTMASALGGLSGLMTLVLGFGSRTTAQGAEERSHLTIITDIAVRAAAPIFMLCVLIALAARQQLATRCVCPSIQPASQRSCPSGPHACGPAHATGSLGTSTRCSITPRLGCCSRSPSS